MSTLLHYATAYAPVLAHVAQAVFYATSTIMVLYRARRGGT